MMVYNKQEYNKKYSREWRKNNKDKIKAYLKRSKDRRSKFRLEYYEKNREKIIEQVKKSQRENNYAVFKTPRAKERQLIRRKTQCKYPLKGNKCDFCENNAQARHHTTEPMDVDKFIFLCNDCHNDIHNRKDFRNKDKLEESE